MAPTKRTPHNPGRNGHTDNTHDINSEIGATIRDSFEASFKAAAALQEQLVSFATHRIQENVSIGEALLKCKNVEDALRMQQDWARSTAEEYIHESTKFMELTRQAMQVGLAPLAKTVDKLKKSAGG